MLIVAYLLHNATICLVLVRHLYNCVDNDLCLLLNICFSNKTKTQNLPLLLLANPRNKCEIDTPSSHIYTSQ